MALIEIFSYLSLLTVATCLVAMGVLSLTGCICLSVILLTGLVLLAWRRFDGGRHPCFLFLATLLVFQAGRLVGSLFGVVQEPMRIDLATAVPLDISTQSAELSLLAITLSAICIYFPSRINYKRVDFLQGEEVRWLPALYALIFITAPFAIYKNLMYLLYIRSHGGYLVVFTDNAAVLQSAGLLARVISLIGANAILVAYVLERRPRRVALILALFFALSTIELLIGFRGKFFSEVLTIWLLHNLKTGRRFTLVPVLVVALMINIIAVVVAGFREESKTIALSPIAFLATQGNSLNVTEAAVEYHDRFSRHGADYLLGGFSAGLAPPTSFREGQLWTVDLTTYLNPLAAKMGFGTASSYLAELYLFAGMPAVALGSIAIGCCLAFLHRISSETWGIIVLAFMLPSLIYLPRAELLGPLAILVKSLAAFTVIFLFGYGYRQIEHFMRLGMNAPGASLG
jgi:hypothetical protein